MTVSSHPNHLQNLIHTYTRRLQLLKEQQALRGLNTPPEIVLEIEDIEARLEQLQIEAVEVQHTSELASQATDLTYLQEQLALYQMAQHAAPAPQRFQSKIKELETDIANWDGRIEQQRQRIANGLDEIRQLTPKSKQAEKRLSIVGQRPLDVIDHFKDRIREQENISSLLAEPATRLVSLIGHGGMGKTALACKILRDLEYHRWPHTDEEIPLDGLVYLSTRTLGISLERLFLDCAKMLGGEQEQRLHNIWTNPQLDTTDKVSRLLEALTVGQYVILLDNMEDLLDDQGQLTNQDLQLFFDQVLSQTHGARLLLTSRQALTFRREVMRFDRQVKLLAGLPIDDGVALLRELDPNGDYGLRDTPEEQLAKAVSLVHGVPRALEVIAGILANDPFATLDEVLVSFFEQEDVVQALIEENYKRLDTDARRVIEALAVFKRPMPPLAVDYLLEPFVPGLDVPGILRRLIRTNLVSIDRATKTINLHPIDQDYAYSQLPEEGAYSRPVLERRAADYYVQLRTPEETWKAIDDLEPQLAEFAHRVRAGDYDEAYRILDPEICNGLDPNVCNCLSTWSFYTLQKEMIEKIYDKLSNPILQAASRGRLGHAERRRGNVQRSIQLHQEALSIANRIGHQLQKVNQLGYLGLAHRNLGEFNQALQLYTDLLNLIAEIEDSRNKQYWLGYWKGNMGNIYKDLGEIEQAIHCYREALPVAHDLADFQNKSNWMGNLGNAYRTQGYIEKAIEINQEALIIAQDLGDRWGQDLRLGSLGLAYSELGEFEDAIKYYQESLEIAREIGDRWTEGARLYSLGNICRNLGKFNKAKELYYEGLDVLRSVGDQKLESVCLDSLGKVAFLEKEFEQAQILHEEALRIAKVSNNRRGQSYFMLSLSRVLLAQGLLAEAGKNCYEALLIKGPGVERRGKFIEGMILLNHQSEREEAQASFTQAIGHYKALLDKTERLCRPRYQLATALVASTVCDPKWVETRNRSRMLTPALTEYQRALEICAASGVIQDVIQDLELIRTVVGIEGLESIFELLEAVLRNDES